MDIPAHVLDAVHAVAPNDPPSHASLPKGITSSSGASELSPSSSHFPRKSQAPSPPPEEDVSSVSEDDPDGYATDYTTPDTFEMPDDVAEFRVQEYPQLKGKTYLDHGGTTLYAKSLMQEFAADMIENLYGNPHSASTPSAIAGHRVDAVRDRALRFFNADPEHFDLVFVANATAAIKLVIECFRDYAASSNTPVWYGYHKDAHTSLVGVREATKLHRCFSTDEEVDIWINSGGLGGPRARQLGLFAYPGQSNMTGRRLPLSWCGRIRKSFHRAATYTLLDAAALASTAPLDLSDHANAPDFVALSFYKIFGFPNIGALIVRKESAHVLQTRRYFGGGTVDMVIAVNDAWHAKKGETTHDRLEDGTLPFHSIFALDHAITVHERLYGQNPMKFISHHTAQLGKQLYDGLMRLKHSNGLPMCRIYKDENAVYGDPTLQGATVAFNVLKSDGSLVPYGEVEKAADNRNIYVRSGSLCNPGGVATYLNWSPAEMKAAYAAGHRCSNPTQIMLGKATGVVRVSLGGMSTRADVQTLLRFLDEVYLEGCNGALASPTLGTGQIAPLSPPASPGPIDSSPLNIPLNHTAGNPTPSMGESHQTTGDVAWETHSFSQASESQTPIDAENPKYPPFNPQDYVKMRRPWDEELRRRAAAAKVQVGMEIKVREIEDSNSVSRNGTPSAKARKFGRSVVNLLRTKNHFAEHNGHVPPPPMNPTIPPGEPLRSASDRYRLRQSLEKTQFQQHVDALAP